MSMNYIFEWSQHGNKNKSEPMDMDDFGVNTGAGHEDKTQQGENARIKPVDIKREKDAKPGMML